jgi:hypothetical protein
MKRNTVQVDFVDLNDRSAKVQHKEVEYQEHDTLNDICQRMGMDPASAVYLAQATNSIPHGNMLDVLEFVLRQRDGKLWFHEGNFYFFFEKF